MLAELSYFQKLWNRGVDIGVGVVTSIIVAGIGLVFWKIKLKMDLHTDEQKQRQQHRINEELEAAKLRREAHERREQLKATRAIFAAQAEVSPDVHALAACWENYIQWMLVNQLNLLSENLKTINEYAAWSHTIRNRQIVADMGRKAAEMIRNTALPPEE